jgi:hypothetical protein
VARPAPTLHGSPFTDPQRGLGGASAKRATRRVDLSSPAAESRRPGTTFASHDGCFGDASASASMKPPWSSPNTMLVHGTQHPGFRCRRTMVEAVLRSASRPDAVATLANRNASFGCA